MCSDRTLLNYVKKETLISLCQDLVQQKDFMYLKNLQLLTLMEYFLANKLTLHQLIRSISPKS